MSHVPFSLAALFGLGMPELILLLVILLLLFGGAKLPALAKGLGQSIKEFKQASKDDPAAEKKPETKTEASSNDASKLRNN
jgi:sec-independent protein translocase protein TatA